MAKTITVKETKTKYAAAIKRIKSTRKPLVVEQNGKPFAVVIPYAEYQKLAELRERARNEKWLAQQHQIIRREEAAFEQMKPELLKTHKGKFVAIHDGKLVDFDADESTLAKRVYARFGYRTILMTEVTETPRVYHVNSPRVVE
jgi:prevent-host-death family protein